MQLSEIQKLDLLRLLVQNRPVEDFIVEWYDAHLDDTRMPVLPYIKPDITSSTYLEIVQQSKLLDTEKKELLTQFENFFKAEAQKQKKAKQPKLKVNEKTCEVDENQLMQ